MLSIGAMKSGQANYYLRLAQEDYYIAGGEPPGTWFGKGAAHLRLTGKVSPSQLRNAFDGFDSHGSKLVQNAGKDNRQPGWDLTFSAPKSVSVLWSQASEAERIATEKAHAAAVESTLSFIEQHFAFSRVGKGGFERERSGLVVATFEHSCSRALDPQLHTHCLVMNLGVDEQGEVRSILSKPFYQSKMLAGAFYRCQLGHELRQRLGVELERLEGPNERLQSWFEVKGVPSLLMKHFSKRRAAIEAELGSRGLESASAAAFATLATREAKELIPPRNELQETWKQEAKRLGIELPHLSSNVEQLSAGKAEAFCKSALADAVAELTHGENTFTSNEVIRRTLEAAQVAGVDAATVVEVVAVELAREESYVPLGTRNAETLWTTKAVLELEREFLSSVATLKERAFRPVAKRPVEEAASAPRRAADGSSFTLDAEQQAAVRYITQGTESVKVVTGFAGTGKTDMLQAAKEALESEGYEVIGTALAGVAARTLQVKAGIPSETIRRREFQLSPSFSGQLKHHAKQLIRAAQGKETHQLKPLAIGPKTVLIIDEAGMVGTRDFALLTKAVVEQGGSVVAVGDQWQLPSIERGGCLAELVRQVDGVHLTGIRRQEDAGDRDAVKNLVAGDAEEALKHYAEKGQLCVGANRASTEATLVREWAANGGVERPTEHRIFVSTRADVARYNKLCQWERLQSKTVNATERVEHDGTHFFVGDQVRFSTSSSRHGIKKGEGGKVIACKDSVLGKYVAVALNGQETSTRVSTALKHHATQLIKAALGKKTTRLPRRPGIVIVPLKSLNPVTKTYDGLTLDYCMTTHLAQGQTVKNSYVHLGGSMTTRELVYVQGSRHKENLFLYCDAPDAGAKLTELANRHRPTDHKPDEHSLPDFSQLITQMQLSRAKELATATSRRLQPHQHDLA